MFVPLINANKYNISVDHINIMNEKNDISPSNYTSVFSDTGLRITFFSKIDYSGYLAEITIRFI